MTTMTVTFPALTEAEGKLKQKQKELGDIFAEAGPNIDFDQVKSVAGSTREKAAHVRALNDECEALGIEVRDLQAARKAAEAVAAGFAQPGVIDGPGDGASTELGGLKGFADALLKSGAHKNKGNEVDFDFDLKTLLTTSAGFAPEVLRTGRVVPNAQRPIQLAELIPTTTTTQASIKYMEETTFTNAAAETAEGGTFPESALAYTERLSAVQKIPTFIPVTDEQLEDVPQVRGLIENRLGFMLRQRLDQQLATGNGTTPNLRGLLNVVGIQTQAKGTDPGPDAFYKAMVKVQTGTGQAMPDTILANPVDWQNIRLLRTADGIYIWGNPSDVGPQTMWGLRVAVVQALTQGTGVVADLGNFTELAIRRDVTVMVGNQHSTFFVEGKQAIRADMRVAFTVYRPAAVCTVTGL